MAVNPTHPIAAAGAPRNARDEVQLVRQIAHWMDKRYIDPIIGLVAPGVGDALGAGIGVLAVLAAYRAGAHPIVLARMLINLAVDAVLGAVPVLGAIFDFVYRAHSRNLALLERGELRSPRASDWLFVVLAALLLLVALCLPIVLLGFTLSWLVRHGSL